ncbi:MAG: ribbon-helix-helix domain-containing protein [Nitrospirota bacterium]|nr:ribbon-helix-helix domain-containing protein [Nitrospirota bacterium]MDH5767754.1 ribbon-helix-helix domain-containing protein [Nitrospirota bacterium]
MSKTKIAITLEEDSVKRLDHLVTGHMFSSRSQAIQEAVKEKLERIERSRLARECRKLDPNFEKAMAEEGLTKDLTEWPEY